ncbi:hypothetical protein SDC9_137799 [bioreactor metagenome]|uniref:Uncharacterized protein n=1 Tax=bioreactor metagenome TaxID=1076179 RepID=A0A645DN04_9ZZZZ
MNKLSLTRLLMRIMHDPVVNIVNDCRYRDRPAAMAANRMPVFVIGQYTANYFGIKLFTSVAAFCYRRQQAAALVKPASAVALIHRQFTRCR